MLQTFVSLYPLGIIDVLDIAGPGLNANPSFQLCQLYAGLTMIQHGHVEISFFIHLHHISYLIWLNGTSSVISPCPSAVCVPVSLYWARHWPWPKLYAELGGMHVSQVSCL